MRIFHLLSAAMLGLVAMSSTAYTNADSGAPPTLYVAPDGNDTNPGTFDRPFRTIQHALDLGGQPGTEIQVRAGTYSEALRFPHDGSADAGFITLRNHGAEKVVLTGEKLPTDLLALVEIRDRSYVRLQGVEVRDFTSEIGASAVMIIGSGDHLEVRNCHFHRIQPVQGYDGSIRAVAAYSTRNREITRLVISGNCFHDIHTGDAAVRPPETGAKPWVWTNSMTNRRSSPRTAPNSRGWLSPVNSWSVLAVS